MQQAGFLKTAIVPFAHRQFRCRVSVAIASLWKKSVSMGDSRNEEATDFNGHRIDARRNGWVSIHGLPVAWRTADPADLPAGLSAGGCLPEPLPAD
jgi:hypothetical protein